MLIMKNLNAFSSLSLSSIVSTFLFLAFFDLVLPTQVAAQPCILTCNDLIIIEVPTGGSKEFLPTDMLEGDIAQSCPNGVFNTQVQINSLWIPGSGNMIFDQSYIGQTVLGRVRDQISGNMCWGNVQIVEALQIDTLHFKLCAKTWKNRPIKGATLTFQPNNAAFPYSPIVYDLDSTQSCADVTVILNDYLPGTTFSYSGTPPVTNALNGLNILDICEISQHILGINPLPSPYAIIAADANKSGSITTFDLVEERKLMLGIYTEFPSNTVWRTFPDYCEFPNPLNPFQSNCLSEIALDELLALDGDTANVIAVKIGDVNDDVRLNNEPFTPPGSADSITLVLPIGPILPGIDLAVPVKLDKDFVYGGIQINLQLDPVIAQFVSLSSGAISIFNQGLGVSYFNPTTGGLRIASLSDQTGIAQSILAGETLFFIHIKTTQNAQLEDILSVVTDDPDVRNFGIGANCTGYSQMEATYSGSVATSSLELRGIRVQPPSPNPYGEQSFLEIELESAETGLLEVVDLMGRVVFSEEKQLVTGVNRWGIPASAVASGSLGIWRLRLGEQMVSGKLARR